jgi:hypothetical protein
MRRVASPGSEKDLRPWDRARRNLGKERRRPRRPRADPSGGAAGRRRAEEARSPRERGGEPGRNGQPAADAVRARIAVIGGAEDAMLVKGGAILPSAAVASRRLAELGNRRDCVVGAGRYGAASIRPQREGEALNGEGQGDDQRGEARRSPKAAARPATSRHCAHTAQAAAPIRRSCADDSRRRGRAGFDLARKRSHQNLVARGSLELALTVALLQQGARRDSDRDKDEARPGACHRRLPRR